MHGCGLFAEEKFGGEKGDVKEEEKVDVNTKKICPRVLKDKSVECQT